MRHLSRDLKLPRNSLCASINFIQIRKWILHKKKMKAWRWAQNHFLRLLPILLPIIWHHHITNQNISHLRYLINQKQNSSVSLPFSMIKHQQSPHHGHWNSFFFLLPIIRLNAAPHTHDSVRWPFASSHIPPIEPAGRPAQLKPTIRPPKHKEVQC